MENDEIVALMNKPRMASNVGKYKAIYQIATGKPWKGCLCGNGWERLWQTCKNYATALKNNLEKNKTQL